MTLRLDERLEVVARARDGREAIDLASSLRPDVVLMDLHMPVLNGIEATRGVRRAAKGSRVVIVTSSTSADDERQAREAGASAYVRKGGFAAELFDAIFDVASELPAARAAQRRGVPPASPPEPRWRRLGPATNRVLRAFL
jgi:DNA-binding NarL/FixJ family response regulator